MALTGAHVTLGPFEAADRDVLFGWINDPALVHLSTAWRPVHGPGHDDWFRTLATARDRVVFAIRDRTAGTLVGVVQLVSIDAVHRNAEMIIRIGAAGNQSRGLGTEALGLLLQFAWRDLNLHRVSARVFAGNGRAQRCYEKCGFVHEGTMREAAFIDGAWTDVLFLGVINPNEAS